MSEPDGAALLVALNDVPVGVLRLTNNLTTFELLDEYLELADRPTLGQIFEESPRRRWQQSQRLPEWFSNLLPEQPMRQLIAEGHGVSPRSEFRLLQVLADDLPGALSLTNVDPYSLLFGKRIEVQAEPPGTADYAVRFSLAGVQIKLSMVWSSNSLTLPGKGQFGDYLIKFPSGRYEAVPENEFYMMSWADAVGIPVPEVALVPEETMGDLPAQFERLRGSKVLTVRRFDKSREAPVRTHMEDLNQVIGNWPDKKYEGASYEKIALLVRILAGTNEYLEFVGRLVFCLGIGNEDAHLKNWSFWYPDRVTPRLSPAYDLVSTIQYDDLDRGLALKLHDSHELARVCRADFERLARKAGGNSSDTLAVVDETLEKMRTTWPEVIERCRVPMDFQERLRSYQAAVPLLASLPQSLR